MVQRKPVSLLDNETTTVQNNLEIECFLPEKGFSRKKKGTRHISSPSAQAISSQPAKFVFLAAGSANEIFTYSDDGSMT